jgi:hypothetical protein
LDPYPLEKGWLWKWLRRKEAGHGDYQPPPVPVRVQGEFESITDLGIFEIKLGDRVFRRVRLFDCRGLK